MHYFVNILPIGLFYPPFLRHQHNFSLPFVKLESVLLLGVAFSAPAVLSGVSVSDR